MDEVINTEIKYEKPLEFVFSWDDFNMLIDICIDRKFIAPDLQMARVYTIIIC